MSDGNGGRSRDTIVGVVGAAVLVAAMAGVFAYERSQFQEYDVSWSTAQAGQTNHSDISLSEGQSETFNVSLAADDLPDGRALAAVEATATWEDDVGQADTVRVAVDGPGNRSAGPQEDDGGSVTVRVDVADEPDATTASGRSPDDAEDQATSGLDAEQGLGEWVVTVELADAPGEADDDNPVTDEESDGTEDVDLTIAWHAWEPSVSG